jgi:hypothetical protein
MNNLDNFMTHANFAASAIVCLHTRASHLMIEILILLIEALNSEFV